MSFVSTTHLRRYARRLGTPLALWLRAQSERARGTADRCSLPPQGQKRSERTGQLQRRPDSGASALLGRSPVSLDGERTEGDILPPELAGRPYTRGAPTRCWVGSETGRQVSEERGSTLDGERPTRSALSRTRSSEGRHRYQRRRALLVGSRIAVRSDGVRTVSQCGGRSSFPAGSQHATRPGYGPLPNGRPSARSASAVHICDRASRAPQTWVERARYLGATSPLRRGESPGVALLRAADEWVVLTDS